MDGFAQASWPTASSAKSPGPCGGMRHLEWLRLSAAGVPLLGRCAPVPMCDLPRACLTSVDLSGAERVGAGYAVYGS